MSVAQGGFSASHTDIFSASLHPFFYTPPSLSQPAFGIPFLGACSQSGRRKGGCAARGLAEVLERQPGSPVAAREASPEQGRGGISQGTEKRAALGGGRPETVGLWPRCPFPSPRTPHGSPRPVCLPGPHSSAPAFCLFVSAGRRKTGDADEDSPRRLLRRSEAALTGGTQVRGGEAGGRGRARSGEGGRGQRARCDESPSLREEEGARAGKRGRQRGRGLEACGARARACRGGRAGRRRSANHGSGCSGAPPLRSRTAAAG